MIDDCRETDAAAICAIYNPIIAETTISFELDPVNEAEMARRIAMVMAGHPWLVWREAGRIRGYAYASKWRERAAYASSVETTIYLAEDARGQGLGVQLYSALLDRLRSGGWHMAMGGIALPNAASVALHERVGFRKVAHFAEVGRKFGRLVDVGYWAARLA